MSILDTNELKRYNKFYIISTLFLIIFSLIYEMFSHEVYSGYMIFAFIFPLFGLLINLFFIRKNIKVSLISNHLFNLSLLTFSLGSIIKGVLDIYGTTNNLVIVYLILGIPLLLTSIITFILK